MVRAAPLDAPAPVIELTGGEPKWVVAIGDGRPESDGRRGGTPHALGEAPTRGVVGVGIGDCGVAVADRRGVIASGFTVAA